MNFILTVTPTPPISSHLPTFQLPVLSSYFISPLPLRVLLMYSWLWEHPLEYSQATRRSTPLKKTDLFFLRFHQPSIAPQLRVGLRNSFSLHARLLTDWPCADLLHETSAAMNLWVKWSFYIRKTLICSSQSKSLALIIFFSPRSLGRRYYIVVSFVTEHLIDILTSC